MPEILPLHVTPKTDSAPHRTDGTPCWCAPRTETVIDIPVVVHVRAAGGDPDAPEIVAFLRKLADDLAAINAAFDDNPDVS